MTFNEFIDHNDKILKTINTYNTMKKTIKQWAWRTLLTLTCLIITSTAWADVTIYVNSSSPDYNMHYWGTGITATTWPGVQFNSNSFTRESIGGISWYKITFSGVNTVNCIFNQGGSPQTENIEGLSGTQFLNYSGGTNYSDVTSTYIKYLDTYYATGNSEAFFGTAWSATAKEMTNDYNGNWTWTSEQVHLDAGTSVGFKVVKNGTNWIPDGNGNEVTRTAEVPGTYTLTVNYALNGTAPTGNLNLIQEDPATYYVAGSTNGAAAGSTDAIFGTAWNETTNEMTTVDNTNYTWTSSQVNLDSGGYVEFKVVKNGVNWIPENNIKCTAAGAGLYTLTVTYTVGGIPEGTLTPLFVTAPVIAPQGGTYDTNQNVTITAGKGTIYYTTDGSNPETSETRKEYTAPVAVHGEGEHVIKAIAIDGNESSEVVTAEYTIKYQNIYLFGSVGKAHAWVYSTTNPELVTSDGVNYSGVFDVLAMPSYSERPDKGLFMLTTGFGTNWETTQQYMIGTTSSSNFWIDGDHNYLGEWVETAAMGASDKGWTLPTGTYEFFYNRSENKLKIEAFDGPTIYVYDYSRPYIWVKDNNGTEFNGEQPANPIQLLDESVGGHRDLSAAGDGSGDGKGMLGWYKFSVPSTNYPISFQFHHNGDQTVMNSDILTTTNGDVYYYWDGNAYQAIAKGDVNKLRRIVAHVRVQGTTVPTCDGVEMNGPSSFYGQMYYWMAVTKFNEGERFVITDGTHNYDNTITSDVYLEWDENSGTNYKLIGESDLNSRLANKTGRGTLIHLLKNKNTPTNKDNYVLGIDTKISTEGTYHNSTNLGTTWWGASLDSKWKGEVGWTDNVLTNYNNSRFIYMENGIDGNPDVYTITSEDGQEWYTWYSDRSTATIKFGYGNSQNGYPTYNENENTYKFFATYESAQPAQTAGEVWYVWTPDFNAQLSNGQSTNNGTLLDVTRTYESRAKQKALCSTFRDGDYVYYTDIKGWGDDHVYCYVWDVPGIDWPGIPMVKVGYDDEGHPVYLADLSNYDLSNADGVIFNNGVSDSHATDKRQTGDLPWENQGCYDYLGLLYRIGGNTDVIDNEPYGENSYLTLRGVWYSRVKGTLFAKGNNDYNNKSENGRGYTDFAKTATDGFSNEPLQSWDYDQSNWVEIYPSVDGTTVTTETLKNLIDMDFTLYGTKQESVNPTFTAVSVSDIKNGGEYQVNHFTPAHFNGSPYQYRTGNNEGWYFFVEPKPNELAEIDWTIYSKESDAFYAYANTGFTGTINVDWSYHDPDYSDQNMTTDLGSGAVVGVASKPDLEDLNGYSGWLAIIKFTEPETSSQQVPRTGTGTQFDDKDVAPSTTKSVGKYTVYPIRLDEDFVTAIEDINVDKRGEMRSLKSTRYYNMMGVESSTPFQGVNIIVKEYSDGSRESSKAIMR